MTRLVTPTCQNCSSCRHNLLNCCTTADIDIIAQAKTSQHYVAGQTIFAEGTRSAGLYCVHQGKIKITKSGGDGKEQILRLGKAGDVLGYRALVADTPHTTSAVALSDCLVCLIPKRMLSVQMGSNPQFSSALLHLLAEALSTNAARMLHLAYKPVRERLAEALLLQSTYRAEGDAQPFTIAISREGLGTLMGTTKETTTRMLSEFKHEGMLTTRGSAITILAPRQLVAIATQFD